MLHYRYLIVGGGMAADAVIHGIREIDSYGLIWLIGAETAGAPLSYDHLPFFYSDLFALGYEAVGELNPHFETFSDWQEPYRKGVIYYLRDGRVRGVLLWNVWEQVEAARALIRQPGPLHADDLKGKLPI